ncbi:MAG: hypothetical protein Q8N26_29085 [Myxococcales bacterium]|nr:hypothetical protein [Myxococcales bacterium]
MRALFLASIVAMLGCTLEPFKTGGIALKLNVGFDSNLILFAGSGCPSVDATAELNGIPLEVTDRGSQRPNSYFLIPTAPSCTPPTWSTGGVTDRLSGPLSITITDGSNTLGLKSEKAALNNTLVLPSKTVRLSEDVIWRFTEPVMPDGNGAAPVNIVLPKMTMKNTVTNRTVDFSMRPSGQTLVGTLPTSFGGTPLEPGTWEVTAQAFVVAADTECVNVAQCSVQTSVAGRDTITVTP